MQGGVNPSLPMDWYTDLLKHLREQHPTIDLDCFSPIEIEGLADVCNLSTLEVLSMLSEAGMQGFPVVVLRCWWTMFERTFPPRKARLPTGCG